jgi:hypothetical protein
MRVCPVTADGLHTSLDHHGYSIDIDDEHADGWKPCREKRRSRAEGGTKTRVDDLRSAQRAAALVDIPAEAAARIRTTRPASALMRR